MSVLLTDDEKETLKSQLRYDEGFSGTAYRDTAGILTVGYGRNLDIRGITRDEAEFLLENDATRVAAEVEERIPWVYQMDGVRKLVILNMAFNLGIGGLLKFQKMLSAAKAGDYVVAARQMQQSKWYRQVGARAARLVSRMRTGKDE